MAEGEDIEAEVWESENNGSPKIIGVKSEGVLAKLKLKLAGRILFGMGFLLFLAVGILAFENVLGISKESSKLIWDFSSELVKVVLLLIIGSYFSKNID